MYKAYIVEKNNGWEETEYEVVFTKPDRHTKYREIVFDFVKEFEYES